MSACDAKGEYAFARLRGHSYSDVVGFNGILRRTALQVSIALYLIGPSGERRSACWMMAMSPMSFFFGTHAGCDHRLYEDEFAHTNRPRSFSFERKKHIKQAAS